MKSKLTLLVILTAIITLSFSFVSKPKQENKDIVPGKAVNEAPIGGFVSER